MDLQEWESQAREGLKNLAFDIRGSMPSNLYVRLCASVLLAVLAQARDGDSEAIRALQKTLGEKITAEIADWLLRWTRADLSRLALKLAERGVYDVEWRGALDAMLLQFDAVDVVRTALGKQEGDRFFRALLEERAKMHGLGGEFFDEGAAAPPAPEAAPAPATAPATPKRGGGPFAQILGGIRGVLEKLRGGGAKDERPVGLPRTEAPPESGAPPELDKTLIGLEDAKPDAPAPAEPRPVLLGASAPSSARPGDEFTARFVAYIGEAEDEVRAALESLSPRSESHLGLKECRWQPGTRVTVVLSTRHLEVDGPEQAFEWNGRLNLVEFDVAVPSDAPETTLLLKYDVYVEEIRLAKLRVDLEIRRRAESGPAQRAETEPAHTAFASYASPDRARVLDRVAAVRTSAGLDVFLDCLSLHPGEQWKPRLRDEILARDLFLLFWSKHSVDSPWVEWEWNTAYDEKGEDTFQLHPLDTVEEAPPPEKLAALHFADPLMVIRRAYEDPSRG